MGPLNIQTKDVDTSFPSVAAGTKVLSKLAGFELKESTNTSGLYMVKLALETEEPANDTKGKELKPGFKFSHNLTLPGAPGQEDHDEMRIKMLASFQDAIRGDDDANTRPVFDEAFLNESLQKQLLVSFKKNKDTTFGETQVGALMPVLA